jgi:hypothetical protein
VREIRASAVAVISEKPDIANARLEFANGSVVNLTASRISTQKMRKLRLFARDNYLSIDLLKKSSEHFHLAAAAKEGTPEGYLAVARYEPTGRQILVRAQQHGDTDMLSAEISSFALSIIEDRPVSVTGEEAVMALEVATEVERVARESLDRVLA